MNPSKLKLLNEITELLLLSDFKDKFGDEIHTAEDIVSFKKRAYDYYNNYFKEDDSFEVNIEKSQFHAKINQKVARISDMIDNYVIEYVKEIMKCK